MGLAAHQIGPGDAARLEQEAPMRLAALGLQLRPILRRELQRGAVIDRRQAARELALAAAVELVGGLVAGIEPPGRAQALGGRVVDRQPLATGGWSRSGTMPSQARSSAMASANSGLRARRVGVVIAQQEAPAMAAREQPVEQRRPGIADMEIARRGRGEADERGGRIELGHGWLMALLPFADNRRRR